MTRSSISESHVHVKCFRDVAFMKRVFLSDKRDFVSHYCEDKDQLVHGRIVKLFKRSILRIALVNMQKHIFSSNFVPIVF